MLGDTKFSPIQRTTAAQAVANQILGEIRRGVLRPGAQLPAERDLMQQLNVGRSSVREALQILATLNLIDSRPGSGTFIRQPQAAEVFRPELFGLLIANSAALELMEARLMVEPAAVRLACVRATAEDLDGIADLLGPARTRLAGERARQCVRRGISRVAREGRTQSDRGGVHGIDHRAADGARAQGGAACRVCTHRGRRAPRDIATRARSGWRGSRRGHARRTSSTRRKPMIPTAPRCRLSPSTCGARHDH